MRLQSAPSATVVIVATTLLAAACGDDSDTGPTAETSSSSYSTQIEDVVVESTLTPDGSSNWDSGEFTAAVAEQRAKWEAARIDNYEFTLYWGVFNLLNGDYRVTVVDGEPDSIRRVGATEPDVGSLDELPRTIDEVFDRLERQVGADRVDVRYDPDLGYPATVRADWIINAVDDELEFRISDFTVT